MATGENSPGGIKAQEGGVGVWENLPIWVALPLAMAAALVSGNSGARQDVASFFAEALKPQTADLGNDPGYLSGIATVTIRLPPPEHGPIGGMDHAMLPAD
jgi:hypothetical protein